VCRRPHEALTVKQGWRESPDATGIAAKKCTFGPLGSLEGLEINEKKPKAHGN